MFDDAPVWLSYNTGLERSLLAVRAVFGNQFGRFFGEFHPSPAFDHGIAGLLCALACHRDGLHGFGCERLGIESLILELEIYGPGITEEDDALLVLDDGDILNVVRVVVTGAASIVVSAVGGDEFVGIVVDHGSSLQIHLAAVYDRQTRRCALERRIWKVMKNQPSIWASPESRDWKISLNRASVCAWSFSKRLLRSLPVVDLFMVSMRRRLCKVLFQRSSGAFVGN